MEYMVFGDGVCGIWIIFGYGIYLVALHHVTLHLELCRWPMVATVPVQHRLLGITMQLHTLLSMNEGVHMHPHACIIGLAWRCSFVPWWVWRQEFLCIDISFFYGLMLDVMETWRYVVINVYCAFMVTHTAMWLMRVGYNICVPLTFTCFIVWKFGYWSIWLQLK